MKRRGFTQNKAVNKVARVSAEDEDSCSQRLNIEEAEAE